MTRQMILVENDLTSEEIELHNVKGVRFYLNNRAYVSVYYDHNGRLTVQGMGDTNLAHQLVIEPASANGFAVSLKPRKTPDT